MVLLGFEILLDNSQMTYLPDQSVSGRIKIVNSTVKRIRGLEVSCKGEAFTSWQRRDYKLNNGNYKDRKKNLFIYEGREKYFKYKFFLLGGKGQEIELAPGDHFYNFTFVLPSNLPPSFEQSKGYIRYSVKARLVRPWKPDQTIVKVIVLANNLDLNLNPLLREQKVVTVTKTVWSFLCISGPISATVSIPQTGYVFEEKIQIRCEIENESKATVREIRFYLKQILHFLATYPYRELERKDLKVAKRIRHCHILPGEVNKFDTVLTVPDVAPSNLSRCSVIDLEYELEVVVDVGILHGALVIKIPITIGTVPLGQEQGRAPSAPEATVQSLTSVISYVTGLATPLLSRNDEKQQHFMPSTISASSQKQNELTPFSVTSSSTACRLLNPPSAGHSYPQSLPVCNPSMLMSFMESQYNISNNNSTCKNPN